MRWPTRLRRVGIWRRTGGMGPMSAPPASARGSTATGRLGSAWRHGSSDGRCGRVEAGRSARPRSRPANPGGGPPTRMPGARTQPWDCHVGAVAASRMSFGLLQGRDLVHASCVSTTLECAFDEGADARERDLATDDAGTKRQHIGVVVLTTEACRDRVGRLDAPDAHRPCWPRSVRPCRCRRARCPVSQSPVATARAAGAMTSG